MQDCLSRLKQICSAEQSKRGKIRIVLINTPLDCYDSFSIPKYDTIYPFGLLLLSELAKNLGLATVVIDGEALHLSIKEIVDFVKTLGPDVVGLNLLSPNIDVASKLCHNLNELGVLLIGGGPHATFEPDDTFSRIPEIRYLFRGEAFYSWQQFLNYLQSGDPIPIGDIRGICQRGMPKPNIGERIRRLDEAPDIQREDVSYPFYHLGNKKETAIFASIGCAEKCEYCAGRSFSGGIVRYRSPKRIIKEMEQCISDFGINAFHFADDNFLQDKTYFTRFHQLIRERNIHIAWRSFTRVDNVRSDNMEQLVSTGCYRLTFGIESGSERTLKRMRKGHTVRQAVDAIDLCKTAGIETKAFFMIGYPGETEQDIEDTIRFAIESGVDWAYFYLVRAFPGTELFRHLLSTGYSQRELLEYVRWIPSVDDELSDEEIHCSRLLRERGLFNFDSILKYNVAHRRSINENISNERLLALMASGYRRFYYRRSFVDRFRAEIVQE